MTTQRVSVTQSLLERANPAQTFREVGALPSSKIRNPASDPPSAFPPPLAAPHTGPLAEARMAPDFIVVYPSVPYKAVLG